MNLIYCEKYKCYLMSYQVAFLLYRDFYFVKDDMAFKDRWKMFIGE